MHARVALLVAVLVAFAGVGLSSAAGPGGKVGVCHLTGSSSNPVVYLEVSDAAAGAHVAHGDVVGVASAADCGGGTPTCATPVPPTATPTRTSTPLPAPTGPSGTITPTPTWTPTGWQGPPAAGTATPTMTPTAPPFPPAPGCGTGTATPTASPSATAPPAPSGTITPTPTWTPRPA